MRIGVIGAGLSGLVAGRELAARGHQVTIFEKSRGLGGRIATRRIGDAVIDHGVPALWSAGPLADLAAGLEEPPREISLPLGDASGALHHGRRPFAYASGLTRLPKQLAADLDVRRGVRIAVLRACEGTLELGDEHGNGHGSYERVVISAPAPQAAELLATLTSERWRAELMRAIAYEPAVVYLAGLRLPAHPPWFGARGLAGGALSWLGVESAKARPVAVGVIPIVAHLNAELSAQHFEATDGVIEELATTLLVDILGQAARSAEWSQVKRWRYAVPTSRIDFSSVNPAESPIVVCGDATAGEQSLDAVLESGRRAAWQIIGS